MLRARLKGVPALSNGQNVPSFKLRILDQEPLCGVGLMRRTSVSTVTSCARRDGGEILDQQWARNVRCSPLSEQLWNGTSLEVPRWRLTGGLGKGWPGLPQHSPG